MFNNFGGVLLSVNAIITSFLKFNTKHPLIKLSETNFNDLDLRIGV